LTLNSYLVNCMLILFSGLWASRCRLQVLCAQQCFSGSPWTEDCYFIPWNQRLGSRKESFALSTV